MLGLHQTRKLQVKRVKNFLALSILVTLFGLLMTNPAVAAPAKKKWTVLVFMSGHNDLSRYTTADLNEMEKVGSTDYMNIVVQRGDEASPEDARIYVQKDNDNFNVTSQVVEKFPRVDMGNYQELIKFLEWGIENYPAEHYFVDVWNHGNGWAKGDTREQFSVNSANNISYDYDTGNSITIPELALALKAASEKAGQKIDIYGSDACLMAMAEVAMELAPFVNIMAGSEEIEPGDGWAYDTFLTEWDKNRNATPIEIGQMLTDTYITSYSSGYRGVTFSIMDLNHMDAFTEAFWEFSMFLETQRGADAKSIVQAAKMAESYDTHPDYIDLMGFVSNLEKTVTGISQNQSLSKMKGLFEKVVVYNKTYKMQGKGMAIWFPTNAGMANSMLTEYSTLRFDHETDWSSVVKKVHLNANGVNPQTLSFY